MRKCDMCDNEYQGEPLKNACKRPSTGAWCSTMWVCPTCAVENPGVFRPDSHWDADFAFKGEEWEG